MFRPVPVTEEARLLFHEGTIALSMAETAGIRIDVPYVNAQVKALEGQCVDLLKGIRSDENVRRWSFSKKGASFSPASDANVTELLFRHMGIEPVKMKGSKPSTDKEALKAIADRAAIIPTILEYRRRKKTLDALLDIRRETVDGYLHPFFNLNSVQTYRSSSDSINFQNQSARDKEMAKIIRTAFIPRTGGVLVESDLKGAEVSISACYHHDPTMVERLLADYDQHHHKAAQIWMLEQPSDVSKMLRYCAKNMFVFPEFYGADWETCAPTLWAAATALKLALPDGTPILEHLRRNGIVKLKSSKYAKDGSPLDVDSFERHIYKIERRMWDTEYPVYRDWKEKWWKEYCKNGGFSMLTGFYCEGYYWRNEVINFPPQGTAFHCLLKSFIETTKWLVRSGMKGSFLVGQIHDSIIADIRKEAVGEYVAQVRKITTEELPKQWKWIVAPIPVEIEASEVNWFSKSEKSVAELSASA